MTRKPKPDAWPLRPGDLPPEWILRREPRLPRVGDDPRATLDRWKEAKTVPPAGK